MNEAKIEEFSDLKQLMIVKRSRAFYVARIGGFVTTVFGGFGFWVWGIATGQIKNSVIAMFVLALIGLSMFIISCRVPSTCIFCRTRLDTFPCIEQRANGRYSGDIFVCRQCNAYEVRLNIDFD
jgi:hypothetical protein